MFAKNRQHHRLNGSSSPVLTATSLSYGKAKNLARLITSARGPVMQNFMQIPPRGASQQMGEIYAKIFLAVHIPFFQKLTYR